MTPHASLSSPDRHRLIPRNSSLPRRQCQAVQGGVEVQGLPLSPGGTGSGPGQLVGGLLSSGRHLPLPPSSSTPSYPTTHCPT